MENIKKILFVCTGNTCRSSMAEIIARDYLKKMADKRDNIEFISAGTGAMDGEPASPQAKIVMSELGLDLSNHRSRELTPELVREADLILAMTERHKNHILRIVPEAKDKVHLLKEYYLDSAELARLTQQAQDLHENLERKRREYFNQHREVITFLYQQKENLMNQLAEIDRQLNKLERDFQEAIQEETQQLSKIEEQLNNKDILDPFGHPVETYRLCAQELREAIAKALAKFIGKVDSW